MTKVINKKKEVHVISKRSRMNSSTYISMNKLQKHLTLDVDSVGNHFFFQNAY